MGKFCEVYGGHQLSELTVDLILDFLNQLTDGCKPQTKCVRYGQLAAFFNFIKNNIIYIPQKVADRLKEYFHANKINLHERIFPICYEAARMIVKKAGKMLDIHLRPHDLRRFCATYASVPVCRWKL
jgi:integrase